MSKALRSASDLEPTEPSGMTRRSALKATCAGSVLGTLASVSGETDGMAQMPRGFVEPDYKIQKGRIRQSIMGWTFDPMPTPDLARLCREIGLVAMEGIDRKHYPMVRELGLQISLVGSHGFAKGPIRRENHAEVIRALREGVDTAVAFGSDKVITFTGMRVPGMEDEQAMRNCVDCWKEVVGYAESKKVTLCLEHLNSRDGSHPMKGHPGYFGDDVERCIELIKRVGSPRFKLLFDIYHVQIMNGDVIRRIGLYKEYIAHYHTAGAPGRGELDDTQEINYPPILRAIVATGYEGYVAQEFLPTWDNKALALRHAAKVCDV